MYQCCQEQSRPSSTIGPAPYKNCRPARTAPLDLEAYSQRGKHFEGRAPSLSSCEISLYRNSLRTKEIARSMAISIDADG
jgi:hypothetical protein